jgi:hypothetical protein
VFLATNVSAEILSCSVCQAGNWFSSCLHKMSIVRLPVSPWNCKPHCSRNRWAVHQPQTSSSSQEMELNPSHCLFCYYSNIDLEGCCVVIISSCFAMEALVIWVMVPIIISSYLSYHYIRFLIPGLCRNNC